MKLQPSRIFSCIDAAILNQERGTYRSSNLLLQVYTFDQVSSHQWAKPATNTRTQTSSIQPFRAFRPPFAAPTEEVDTTWLLERELMLLLGVDVSSDFTWLILPVMSAAQLLADQDER